MGELRICRENPRIVNGIDIWNQNQCVVCASKPVDTLPHRFIDCENPLPGLIKLRWCGITSKNPQCPVHIAGWVDFPASNTFFRSSTCWIRSWGFEIVSGINRASDSSKSKSSNTLPISNKNVFDTEEVCWLFCHMQKFCDGWMLQSKKSKGQETLFKRFLSCNGSPHMPSDYHLEPYGSRRLFHGYIRHIL